MSWTSVPTWIVSNVPRSSDLNAYIRDNFNWLYNTLTANPYTFAIQRQGGDASNWQTAGSTNYTPTDAFIQCGITQIFSLSTTQQDNSMVVTLPRALSGTGSAVAFVTGSDPNSTTALDFRAMIQGTTALFIAGGIDPSTSPASLINIEIKWMVIGR